MPKQYIVAIPTPMGGAFIGCASTITSEYPNACLFNTLASARRAASGYDGAQVYTVEGYAAGAGPVLETRYESTQRKLAAGVAR